jgi:hypothetical protein
MARRKRAQPTVRSQISLMPTVFRAPTFQTNPEFRSAFSRGSNNDAVYYDLFDEIVVPSTPQELLSVYNTPASTPVPPTTKRAHAIPSAPKLAPAPTPPPSRLVARGGLTAKEERRLSRLQNPKPPKK